MAHAPLPRRTRARKPVVTPCRPIVVIIADLLNADGLPRAGLLHPGARVPVLFPNIPAALAALDRLEVRA